jgi:long-chain acyl-CoA synthetase
MRLMKLTEESNLSDFLLTRLRETPHGPAYRQFTDGEWVDMNWEQFGREVGRWRYALQHAGLQPGDRVAMCLRNSIEWVLFDQAALGLALVTVPLYFDDRPENMVWSLNDAGVRLLLLETNEVWPALKSEAKSVERAVCVRMDPARADERVISLHDWLPRDAPLFDRSPARRQDLATIVYTSGTTGRPKGVMLSHGNILSNVLAGIAAMPVRANDRFFSFLPLSHTFERTVGYYLPLALGAQMVYARGISQLVDDMQAQRPTILVTVPRIFERLYAKLQEAMPPQSLRRRLFEQAVNIGWKRFKRQAAWHERLFWPLLWLSVARRLYRRLGGRLKLIVVGGAALAPDLSRVFIGLGLPIVQGYGLTEASPVVSVNRINDNDPLSVGRPLEGIESTCDEKGELLVRGPNVMAGYWNNPEATKTILDSDGWLHTGDLARIRDGRIYITGREKEIVVLSNGEKIPPVDAEQAISADPVFEHAMVVGEGRPGLGLLAVCAIEDAAEICARANERLQNFPGYARIRYLARVKGPWTVENGLLTPTLKLKRREIERRYAKDIENMYRRGEIRSSIEGRT